MTREQIPVGYLLERAQAGLRQAMDSALEGAGLTLAQFAVMSSLVDDDGLTNADLARRSFVHSKP